LKRLTQKSLKRARLKKWVSEGFDSEARVLHLKSFHIYSKSDWDYWRKFLYLRRLRVRDCKEVRFFMPFIKYFSPRSDMFSQLFSMNVFEKNGFDLPEGVEREALQGRKGTKARFQTDQSIICNCKTSIWWRMSLKQNLPAEVERDLLERIQLPYCCRELM